MTIDPTITTGNVIEITVFILGVIAFMLKRDGTITTISKELGKVQKEIEKLSGVVTAMALADLRINNIEQDIREIRHDIREMRHGRGFVKESLDKEWDGGKS